MMHEHDATELENEPIGKLLAKYSFPAITGLVAYSLYNIIASVFIGHGVGPMAISGLAVTFPVMNLTFAFGLLVGIGGSSVASIRLGQKNLPGAARVLGNALVLSLINGLALGLSLLYFLDPILIAFGASENTLPYARDFMQVLLAGLPVTYTMFNLNHQMRASGYPNRAMISVLMTVVISTLLTPVLIFVLELGMRGAALAAVLAQCAGLAWVLFHFCNKDNTLHFQPGIYRLKKEVVRSIFSIGLSPFLLNACACLIVVIVNLGLKRHGGDLAIGAYGIVNRVLILLFMTVVGLTQGMQPILGYNYGARRMDRVKLTLKYGVIAGTGITTAGFAASELFPGLIAAMFTKDATLIALATDGLRIMTAAFPLAGSQIVIANFFQSIGWARVSIFLSMSRQWLFLIPGLLIFPSFMGVNGVWISVPIADTLAFIVTSVLLYKYLKKMALPD